MVAGPCRMLTVWWAHWPVVAAHLGRGSDGAATAPAIVIRSNRVVACSASARAAGVVIGQRRRQAQQRCPDATLIDHDPDRDARAFESILGCVGAFAPRIEVIEPGWLCLETRGPSRYFGGDERLVEQIVAAVRESGPTADATGLADLGIGVADGRFASAVAARLCPDVRAHGAYIGTQSGPPGGVIVPAGQSAAFLAPRPVAWLHETGETSVDLVGLFARLGLSTLGDLAALARSDVAGRFGPPGEWAHRLAGGHDDRLSRAEAPPTEQRIEQVFDDPVEQLQPLVFVGKQLADQLVESLTLAGMIATRIVVTAETDHGERSERVWYRGSGLSAGAMVERIRWQLEGWIAQPGGLSSGVVLVRIDPDELRPDGGEQLRLWGGLSSADERAVRVVTRLAGMVGESAVLVPAWQGGRLPGDRYRWIPATTTDLTDADDTAERLRPRLVDGSPDVAGVAASRSRSRIPSRPKRGTTRGRKQVEATGGSWAAGPTSTAGANVTSRTAARLGPWPGALPIPSPSVVPTVAIPAVVADIEGAPISVGGRGELSSAPVTLTVDGQDPLAITAWAGPWPVDEWWWDERRHRRLARFQLVTADGMARLAVVEHQQWWILAVYA